MSFIARVKEERRAIGKHRVHWIDYIGNPSRISNDNNRRCQKKKAFSPINIIYDCADLSYLLNLATGNYNFIGKSINNFRNKQEI
jgi:hypothetical protein